MKNLKVIISAALSLIVILSPFLFLFTFVPIALCAIFKKVEWKHIAHKEMSDEDKKRLGIEEENEA